MNARVIKAFDRNSFVAGVRGPVEYRRMVEKDRTTGGKARKLGRKRPA